jgi:hypothetical protein
MKHKIKVVKLTTTIFEVEAPTAGEALEIYGDIPAGEKLIKEIETSDKKEFTYIQLAEPE